MNNIWKIFRKEAAKITPRRINIQDLTPEERAEIEERAELGAASRDIADSLGLDVNVIYNYKKSLKERAVAQASKPFDNTKEILANKVTQREILKEDFELEKLKLDLEKSKQQMQMEQIRFLQEIKQTKEELLADNGLDPKDSNDIPWSALLELLTKAFESGKKGSSGSFEPDIYTEKPFTFDKKQSPQTQKSRPAIEDSQVTAGRDAEIQDTLTGIKLEEEEREEYITMSDEEIRKTIAGIKAQYGKTKFSAAKLLPDKLLFDKIAEQFPTLSDQSIDRSIQILRTEF
jgi:DNA-binding CsgD family transcriptional regulator